MLNYLVSKLMTTIKKKEYKLDSNIYGMDILLLCSSKLTMYIRGAIKGCGLKGSKKNLFIGKKTNILFKSHIYVGEGVQIKDFVEINGLSKTGIVIGNNASIGNYSIIRGTGSVLNLGKGIKIGSDFGCGDFCFFGCSGGIVIGDNVIMGQNVRFHSQNHNFDRVDIVIREQGVNSKGISVGDDCWLGSGVTILDGVNIGNGCVIGANSLVNKDIPPYSVVVGNPCRIIKHRV